MVLCAPIHGSFAWSCFAVTDLIVHRASRWPTGWFSYPWEMCFCCFSTWWRMVHSDQGPCWCDVVEKSLFLVHFLCLISEESTGNRTVSGRHSQWPVKSRNKTLHAMNTWAKVISDSQEPELCSEEALIVSALARYTSTCVWACPSLTFVRLKRRLHPQWMSVFCSAVICYSMRKKGPLLQNKKERSLRHWMVLWPREAKRAIIARDKVSWSQKNGIKAWHFCRP